MRFVLALLCLATSGMLVAAWKSDDPIDPSWRLIFWAIVLTYAISGVVLVVRPVRTLYPILAGLGVISGGGLLFLWFVATNMSKSSNDGGFTAWVLSFVGIQFAIAIVGVLSGKAED